MNAGHYPRRIPGCQSGVGAVRAGTAAALALLFTMNPLQERPVQAQEAPATPAQVSPGSMPAATPSPAAPVPSPAASSPTPAPRPDGLEACRPASDPAPDKALEAAAKLIRAGRAREAAKALQTLAAKAPADARVLYHQARLELRTGKRARALETLRRAASSSPACVPALTLLGETLLAVPRAAEAADAYSRAVDAAPDHLEARAGLARALVASSQLDRAEPHLRWLRDRDPGDAETWAAWAELQGWRGEAADALFGFERAYALRKAVLTPDRYQTWGDALRKAGRPDDAISRYEKALQRAPRSEGALVGLGYAQLDLKRPAEAVTVFTRATRLKGAGAGAWAGLARALQAARRTPDAIAAYGRAVKLTPGDLDLRLEAAQVMASDERRRGEAVALLEPLVKDPASSPRFRLAQAAILSWMPERRELALTVLEPLLARTPPFLPAWELARQTVLWITPGPALVPHIDRMLSIFPEDRALLTHRAGALAQDPARTAEAVAAFDRLLEADPENVEARLARAELLVRLDPRRAGLADELRSAAAGTKDPALLARAGIGLLTLRVADSALTTFDACLEAAPAHLPCLTGRADALSALDRPGEALATLEKALPAIASPADRAAAKLKQTDLRARASRNEAVMLTAKGQAREAEAIYQELIRTAPKDPHTWAALGALQAGRRDFQAALASFRRAIELEPNHLGALQGAAGTLEALGRLQEAKAYLRRELEVADTAGARQRLARLERREAVAAARKALRDGEMAAVERLGRLYLETPDDLEAAMAFGEALLLTKRYPEAAEVYTRAVGQVPDDPGALRGAATALWEAKQPARAREMLSRARAFADEAVRSELDRLRLGWEATAAEAAKAGGDLGEALERYRIAFDLAPTEAFVLKGIAGVYWANQQLELAAKFYLQATRLHPEDLEALKSAIELLIQLRMPDRAAAVLEARTDQADPTVAALLERARMTRDLSAIEAAWKRGEPATAEALAAEIAAPYPKRLEPWLLLARLSGLAGDPLKAVRYYRQALEVDPEHDDALMALIASLQTLGRHTEAADLIGQARARYAAKGEAPSALDGLEANWHAATGESFKRQGDLKGALEAYGRAIRLLPRAPWILNGMAGVYATNSQMEDALELYEHALRYAPQDPMALKGQARALLELKLTDEAEEVVKRLTGEPDGEDDGRRESLPASPTVAPAPADPEVALLEADLLRASGRLTEAIARYQAMRARDPEDLSASRGLVGAYLAAGRPKAALELLTTLLSAHGNDPDLLDLTATTLDLMGRNDLAFPVLRKLVHYWPAPELEARLERAHVAALVEAAEEAKRREDLKGARRLYDEARRRAPEDPVVLRGIAGVEAEAGDLRRARELYAKVLDELPDDPIALVGHAGTVAAQGEVQGALRELKEGWSRTKSSRVGLERVSLLIQQARYAEADAALQPVERLLEENGTDEGIRTEELEIEPAAPVRAGRKSALSSRATPDVVARFERTWRRIARVVPANVTPKTRPVLPPPAIPSPSRASGPFPAPASGAPAGSRPSAPPPAAPVPGAPLPDIGPGLPPLSPAEPAGPASTPGVASASSRLDLVLVERLLQAPPQAAAVRWQPVSSSEGALPGRASQEGERPAALEEPDSDDYAPFRPTAARLEAETRVAAPAWDPEARAVALRKEIDLATAPRVELSTHIDGRNGVRGSTGLASSYFDLEMTFFPARQVHIQPYVSAGMVTDGDLTDEGVMAGVALGLTPGPLAITGSIGTSPVGFTGGVYPVGRVAVDVSAVERLRFGLEGALEPVTDSLQAWAGKLDTDGEAYGRVSRARLGASATLKLDVHTGVTLGADLGLYSGLQIEENDWRQARLAIDHGLELEGGQQVTLGVELTWFGFELQQDLFQPGSGGYFSPRMFALARARGGYGGVAADGRLRYLTRLGLGMQYADGEPSIHLSPGARAVVTFDLDLGYRITRGMEVGFRFNFDNAGAEYVHGVGWLYLEKRFGVE